MIIVDVEQGSPEWHSIRAPVPTASGFSRFITAGGKASKSAIDYMGEIIDAVVRPLNERDQEEQDAVFGGNRHTNRGHVYEPKGRNWYRFVTGSNVQEVGFILNDERSAGCSPDSLVDDDGGLEIKSPEGKKHASWMIEGVLPEEHKAQVHGCLVVTGRKWWDFVSYCPGYKPFKIRTYRDEYTKAVERELASFLERLEAAKKQLIEEAA